ncbi:MAG: helix-hairpin-helix domain-containing protein [Bacteroidales bacterium]|nr:helix-hairpin-helix domain-containing protein [Bacteroidales bacterium]
MKQLFKDYFTFTKTERNGAFILILIIIILLLFLFFSKYFFKQTKTDFSEFKKQIDEFASSQKSDSVNDSTETPSHTYFTEDDLPIKRNLFYFNPNNLPESKWQELGLSNKQIKIIKNYESKGGKFFRKEDLKKIYGITEKDYTALSPYIIIPDNKGRMANNSAYQKSEKNKNIVEINSADTNGLKTLKGIGSSFAKRIIKYRNSLGGFYKKEQLLEVWGIDSVKYFQFIDFVEINPAIIKKININSSGVDEIKTHPYIKYNIANAIVNYRKQHGSYKTTADIKKIVLIDEKIFQKISPYLKIE